MSLENRNNGEESAAHIGVEEAIIYVLKCHHSTICNSQRC